MANEIMSVEGQLVGMPLAGPESFSQQQLDYLKRALGVDETVLWEGTYTSDNAGITFSESYKNFEFIRVEYANNDGMNESKLIPTNQTATMINLPSFYVGSAQTHVALKDAQYTIGNTSLVYLRGVDMNIGASTTVTAVCHITVYKVVGVHRIAGGN